MFPQACPNDESESPAPALSTVSDMPEWVNRWIAGARIQALNKLRPEHDNCHVIVAIADAIDKAQRERDAARRRAFLAGAYWVVNRPWLENMVGGAASELTREAAQAYASGPDDRDMSLPSPEGKL